MSTRTRDLVVGLVVVAAGAAASAADWPGWRGPARDARSAETGLLQEWAPAGPPLAWSVSGLGGGLSSLAVVGNRIYTMGDKNNAQHVVALDRATGKVVWSTRVGAPWDDEYGGPRGTPTVDGALLYAIGTEGDLVCLETATGKARSAGARACPATSAGR
jgi:outer membrane protein assembly factor BamB